MKNRIINLSTDDTRILPGLKKLAAASKLSEQSEVTDFTDDCFADFKGDSITLYGHGGTHVFGEKKLKPAELVKELAKCNFPFAQVKRINLFACSVGFLGEGPSYALRFADALYQLDNTHHIQVGALNDLVTDKPLALMTVFFTVEAPYSVYVTGVATENNHLYEKECKDEQNKLLDQHYNNFKKYNDAAIQFCNAVLNDPIFQSKNLKLEFADFLQPLLENLQAYIADTIKNNHPNEITQKFKRIQHRLQNFPNDKTEDGLRLFLEFIQKNFTLLLTDLTLDGNKKDSEILTQFTAVSSSQYKERFAEWPSLQAAFESSNKFLITHAWCDKLMRFDRPRWLLWATLQDRMAEIEKIIATTTFFRSEPSLKLYRLMQLAQRVLDSKHSIEDDIEQALELVSIKQAKTLIKLSSTVLKNRDEETNSVVWHHEAKYTKFSTSSNMISLVESKEADSDDNLKQFTDKLRYEIAQYEKTAEARKNSRQALQRVRSVQLIKDNLSTADLPRFVSLVRLECRLFLKLHLV